MTTEEFIHKCTELHGDIYSYDKVIYVNRYTKVTITCTQCNTTYNVTPITFCRPHKCKWCIALARKQQQEKINKEKQDKKEKQQQANNTKSSSKRHKKAKASNTVRTHTVKPPPPQHKRKRKKHKRSKKMRWWRDSDWKKAGEHSKAFHAFAVYVILCYDDNTGEKFIKIGKTFHTVESRFREFPYKWVLIAYWSGDAYQVSNAEREMHGLYKDYKYLPLKHFGGHSECFSLGMLSNIYLKKDIHE